MGKGTSGNPCRHNESVPHGKAWARLQLSSLLCCIFSSQLLATVVGLITKDEWVSLLWVSNAEPKRLFCLNRYNNKNETISPGKKRDTISHHQWEENWKANTPPPPKKITLQFLGTKFLSTLKSGGEEGSQRGEKRPIRSFTDSDVFKMFDVSLAAMTHFCTVVKSTSDQKPPNKCYCVPLLPCGFEERGGGGGDFLQKKMCNHPARIAINHWSIVGSAHRQDHALRIKQLFHFPEVNARHILNGSYASAFLHSATP